MPYFTKSQAREAAHRGGFRTEGRVGPPRQLNEEVLAKRSRVATATDSFDVFLSHSHQDAELVLGAAKLLEERSLKVYVDWVVDRDRSNTATTPAHARMVRARMRQCRSLLYLCTDNSMGSKWTPWELGYFDAFRGTVAILPLLDTGNAAFSGAEYLGSGLTMGARR